MSTEPAAIKTSSDNTTYYREVEISVVEYPSTGEQCTDPEHEHAPIYCMWHGQMYSEHEAGQMCLDCDKQWFFSPDWSTPQCRRFREFEGSSRIRLFFARVDRLIQGWKWRNAWTYKP